MLFYNSKILECGNDFKTMFFHHCEILQKKKSSKLPDHDSPVDLANQFAHYFMSKIEAIRTICHSSATESDFPSLRLQYSQDKLSWQTFTNVSEADVVEIITKSPCPSCLLDTLPSWLVKQQLDILLLAITAIVNRSLSEGFVPESLKSATSANLPQVCVNVFISTDLFLAFNT